MCICMALVEQLRDNGWYVVYAACCHVALILAIMLIYTTFKNIFFCCLCPFRLLFLIFFCNLVPIN